MKRFILFFILISLIGCWDSSERDYSEEIATEEFPVVLSSGSRAIGEGLGWTQQRAKVNFRDSVNFKGIVNFEIPPIGVGGGNGGSMTWPASAGIAVYSGTQSWSTSITDNSSHWNTAYSWGDHSLAGYINSITATSIAEGVLDNAIDDAIIGVAAEDVLGGSTGRDRYMSPQQIYDYVSQHGGGGGGSFQGQIKEFTVDDVGGPQEGMLAYTNPDFAGYQVWTLRDGVRDNKCIQAGSTITADLEWQEDEGITFLLWPHGTWEDISSEQEVLNSIKDKLVIYYKLDETTGTTVTDEMGNLNAEVRGGTSSWVPGIINNGYHSDSIPDYIRVSSNNTAATVTEPFSVSIWFNFDKLGSQHEEARAPVIWVYNILTSPWTAIQLYTGSTDRLVFNIRNTDGDTFNAFSDAAITANIWHHAVVSCHGDGVELDLYLDGVRQTNNVSTFVGDIYGTPNYLMIGQMVGSTAHVAKTVDEFMLFNEPLTSEEVGALWNEGNGIQLTID